MYVWHLQYLFLLYVGRRHWMKKRENRLRDELRFTKRLIEKNAVTAQDWARAMF